MSIRSHTLIEEVDHFFFEKNLVERCSNKKKRVFMRLVKAQTIERSE